MRTLIFVVALGSAVLLANPQGDLVAQQNPVVGNWAINLEESDDPQEVMQALRGGGGPPMRGRGGAGRAGGGRGSAEGAGRGGGGAMRGRGGQGGPMSFIMRPVDRLSIELTESNFSITTGDQPALLLYTDGKKWTETVDGFGDVEFQLKHKDGELEVVRTFEESGMTVKESYKLDDDDGQLEVTTRVSGGRVPESVEIKRVFDRVGGREKGVEFASSSPLSRLPSIIRCA